MNGTAVALIDYDNVKPAEDRTAGDVGNNLADVVPAVVAEALQVFTPLQELDVRIYGGWIDEQGRQTHRAQWLLAGLSWYRGRRGRTIVRPTLVTSLACHDGVTLLGTVRRSAGGLRQKMVDIMIAVDAIHFLRDCQCPVLVFSDDDDLVPVAVAAGAWTPAMRFHWLRRRQVGTGMNDLLLRRIGVSFGSV